MHDSASTGEVLLQSHPNFRCLGGTMVEDGRRVRSLRFLRAPALVTLTDADASRLGSLDPCLIVDFRGVAEAEETPIDLPPHLAGRRLAIPIEPSATPRFKFLTEQGASHELSHAMVVDAMIETYRDFVRVHASAFEQFIKALAASDDRPVMFHCTAGKDRTGVAAALILVAMGAQREAIMRNYLATASLWKPDARLLTRLPAAAHAGVYGVSELYLDAALDEFEKHYGSALAFICDALGGEKARAEWASRHLEGA